MKREIDLSGDAWTLDGFMLNEPLIPLLHAGALPAAAIPGIPARVPGSVHDDLRASSLVTDWNNGLNSQHCEWVNNRHWRYRRTLNIPALWQGLSIWLCADGLDDSGYIFVNDRLVASFEGALKRHEFDLTPYLSAGQTAELAIVFDPSPRIAGNCGFTSTITRIKPRFGYGWDWCSPLVNIGIWDSIILCARTAEQMRDLVVTSDLDESLRMGLVRIRGMLVGDNTQTQIRIRVEDAYGTAVFDDIGKTQANIEIDLEIADVLPWWPVGMGEQPLYQLHIDLMNNQGQVIQTEKRTLGFRRVRWVANTGAPADAIDYTCVVNHQPVFMKGVNWVPLSPFYGSVRHDQYEERLRQYLAMNVNILRVWGGGPLERSDFYELCDQLGLMIWQEFPLSSSLLDNWPPEDPRVINELRSVAKDYVRRRAHHASLVVWCGGNELQGSIDGNKQGIGKPVDFTHPCIAAFVEVLKRNDPVRKFLPTSASGPRFMYKDETRGLGMHHDVHGPWELQARGELEKYWNQDDSLLRSEVGVPGMSRASAIRRSAGSLSYWPPDKQTLFWAHHARQWLPMKEMQREFGSWDADDPSQLQQMVRCSQFAQADNYRYAIEACRRRGFSCSGILLWMGHDLYHMASNNSVIEHDGTPKMAYYAAGKALAPLHISALLKSMIVPASDAIEARIYLHDDHGVLAKGDSWFVRLYDLSGNCLREMHGEAVPRGCANAMDSGSIQWSVPAMADELLILRCGLEHGGCLVRSDYIISQRTGAHPLAPLRALRRTTVTLEAEHEQRIMLQNTGMTAAVGLWPAEKCDGVSCTAWPMVLFPGEAASLEINSPFAHEITPPIRMDGMNLSGEDLFSERLATERIVDVRSHPTVHTFSRVTK